MHARLSGTLRRPPPIWAKAPRYARGVGLPRPKGSWASPQRCAREAAAAASEAAAAATAAAAAAATAAEQARAAVAHPCTPSTSPLWYDAEPADELVEQCLRRGHCGIPIADGEQRDRLYSWLMQLGHAYNDANGELLVALTCFECAFSVHEG